MEISSIALQVVSGFLYIMVLFYGIKKRLHLVNHLLVIFLYVSVVAILSDKLFPIITIQWLARPEISYIPFEYIKFLIERDSLLGYAVNHFILFAPLGILIPIMLKSVNTLMRILGFGVLSFAIIEGMKASISYLVGFRYANFITDDLLFIVVNILLGYGILHLAAPILSRYINLQHISKGVQTEELPDVFRR